LIAGYNEGDNQKLTEYQVWILQQKCMLISLALSKAVEMMPTVKNWDFCCKLALIDASKLGVKVATTSRTIRNWYCEFRKKWKFPMYLPEKPILPQFLDENKDICHCIQQYPQENLNKLSIEFMSEYLHDVILPKMIKEEYGLEPMDETYEEKTIELGGRVAQKECFKSCGSEVLSMRKNLNNTPLMDKRMPLEIFNPIQA